MPPWRGVWVAGGYLIGLTEAWDLSVVGLATSLGVSGFWVGAIAGMFLADVGIIAYFLRESSPRNARARANVEILSAT